MMCSFTEKSPSACAYSWEEPGAREEERASPRGGGGGAIVLLGEQ